MSCPGGTRRECATLVWSIESICMRVAGASSPADRGSHPCFERPGSGGCTGGRREDCRRPEGAGERLDLSVTSPARRPADRCRMVWDLLGAHALSSCRAAAALAFWGACCWLGKPRRMGVLHGLESCCSIRLRSIGCHSPTSRAADLCGLPFSMFQASRALQLLMQACSMVAGSCANLRA